MGGEMMLHVSCAEMAQLLGEWLAKGRNNKKVHITVEPLYCGHLWANKSVEVSLYYY